MLIGTLSEHTRALADGLGEAEVVAVPEPPAGLAGSWDWDWAPVLERWRSDFEAGPPEAEIVVCTWPAALAATPFLEVSPQDWRARAEWPTALWFVVMVGAVNRCADGGSVVVVTERPAAIDVEGYAPEVGVAEGILCLVRSLATLAGDRRVRINAVTSEILTAPAHLVGAPPSLPSFPGSAAIEIAGAVRMLLSPEAGGVTGTKVHADCGRTW
jgi:NAD(P)-dependent dehydrogenase (short-subunit alcohol dehydrogenase family)